MCAVASQFGDIFILRASIRVPYVVGMLVGSRYFSWLAPSKVDIWYAWRTSVVTVLPADNSRSPTALLYTYVVWTYTMVYLLYYTSTDMLCCTLYISLLYCFLCVMCFVPFCTLCIAVYHRMYVPPSVLLYAHCFCTPCVTTAVRLQCWCWTALVPGLFSVLVAFRSTQT